MIELIRQGESLPFIYTLPPNPNGTEQDSSQSTNWTCTIYVRQYPSDTPLIEREIDPTNDVYGVTSWQGYLTSSETAALDEGTYRLAGVLYNSVDDEEVQEVSRFKVSPSWGESS